MTLLKHPDRKINIPKLQQNPPTTEGTVIFSLILLELRVFLILFRIGFCGRIFITKVRHVAET